MTNNERLAYIAGFVDGEGYIGIKKYIRNTDKKWCPMYSEKISVAGINEKSIRQFDDFVKGYIYFHKPSKLSNRGYWSWEVTENKARDFLKLIYSYLIIKKPEAEKIMLLSENKKKTNRAKISLEDTKLREKLYQQIKELHNGQD